MQFFLTLSRSIATPGRMAIALSAILLLSVVGCPMTEPIDNGDGTNTNGTDLLASVSGEIVTLRNNLIASELEAPIAIHYSITGVPPQSVISAFFVTVPDPATAISSEDSRVIFRTDLVAGESAFNFDPSNAGSGYHKLGLLVRLGDETVEIVSAGVVVVEGGPSPRFVQPADATTVVMAGDPVPVTFDAGDPQDDVAWRLFLLAPTDSRDNPEDRLGEALDTGFGNIGRFTLSTLGRPVGRYELGLSATDSGLSIAATVADGKSDLIVTTIDKVIEIVELVDITDPTFAFTAPGLTDVDLFGTQDYTIRFEASADPAGGIVEIDIYVDDDCNPSNGKTRLNNDPLPVTATTISLPTDLPEGTYCVIGQVRQAARLVEVTAPGRLTIARSPTLSVLAPDTALPIGPTDTIEIRWTTNVPEGFGLIDVFARTLDADGEPFGSEIPITSKQPTTVTSAPFLRSQSGVYEITVRLTLSDPAVASVDCPNGQCLKTSPRPIRVSTVPPIIWVGELAKAQPAFEGAIFEGVNFEDNAGTSFSAVNDLDGDGVGEFLIAARYGKPFLESEDGVGAGEAYLIYGGLGASRLTGVFNLNSVGTTRLRGVTFTGVRTPQGSSSTDGMSSVSRLPDVDGDGREELVFGFPKTDSRGHNVSPEQDGRVNPRSLATLEREKQFLRGGLIIVSSRNSILSDPQIGEPVIKLDLVGQDFRADRRIDSEFCVQRDQDPDLPDDVGGFALDVHGEWIDDPNDDNEPGCEGSCDDPSTGGKSDATAYIDFGFVAALARDFFSTYVYSREFYGGVDFCPDVTEPFVNSDCLDFVISHEYCAGSVAACEPFSPGLHAEAIDPDGQFDEFGNLLDTRLSGLYPQFITGLDDDNVPDPVLPREPLGGRIIGVGIDDGFGTSITLSNATGTGAGDIIVSSPGRTARGIEVETNAICPDPTVCGGEIDGLGSSVNSQSGVAYVFSLRSLWTEDSFGRVPPRPHQYIVGEGSHCGGDGYAPLIDNIEATRIAGFTGDEITNIVGIDDFNNDGLDDFAIGAPNANEGQGRVYVAFRRGSGLEGDFVLDKLALSPNDPERLTGVLIVTDDPDGMGSSLATGVDFNQDGISDLVIGSPNANGGVGEIIVVFGDANLRTPENGTTVETLLTDIRTEGGPRAARITGNALDLSGHFGFNVANAGDVDGDGHDDLLISAPGATPRFDPDPTDDDDTLTASGIDANFDGCPDDVSGKHGIPDFTDGCVEFDRFDELKEAGLVYVIYSSNRLDLLMTCSGTEIACEVGSDCEVDEECLPSEFSSININQLGKSQLRGLMIAGRREGDRIGGGDAGSVSEGGIQTKSGRGRSNGLASAGDVDGDGRADILIGAVLADPRIDPNNGVGVQNGGEAYLIYGSVIPTGAP
ncbi:MAG: FG-GAP repeat protein [Planctomycetes bacterium]|nr:FG-GAP repeat protein [Planctomycetota bacterium]